MNMNFSISEIPSRHPHKWIRLYNISDMKRTIKIALGNDEISRIFFLSGPNYKRVEHSSKKISFLNNPMKLNLSGIISIRELPVLFD